jgi:hypothetical protein
MNNNNSTSYNYNSQVSEDTSGIGNNNYTYNSNSEILNQDIESFIKYIMNIITKYESNINNAYVNIKNVLNKLEIEFPQIDINCFSDFLEIVEEYYNLINHAKILLQKTDELDKENQKYKQKIDRTNGKKISLKALNENLAEENKFKDFQMKKLEEDLNNLQKEYLEITSKIAENEILHKNPSDNYNEIGNETYRRLHTMLPMTTEYKQLSEENSNLQKDNMLLLKRVESLEYEIRNKCLPKNETEKKMILLESERNIYSSKFKICEINLEKLRKEVQSLRYGNDELQKELEKSEKKS